VPARRHANARFVVAHDAGISTPPAPSARSEKLAQLQRSAGNAAVARLIRSQEERAGHKVRAVLASSGRPLEPTLQAQAEAHLGVDLGDVRVHDDAAAGEAAASVQAEAFTSGSHVVFRPGAHDPDSSPGRRRLMHELTHVAQQQAGPVHGVPTAGQLQISEPGDAFERAAEQSAVNWSGQASVQRDESPDRP
jgi:Domain of unknown function (DUF4157)